MTCIRTRRPTRISSRSARGAGDEGTIYIFTRSSTGWILDQELTENDEGFGECVAISGDTIVVGAPANDMLGLDLGSAYVYVFDSGLDDWVSQG